MKLTQIFFRQHIGRMFKRHWKIQGQSIPTDTGAENGLKLLGFPVVTPDDILKKNPTQRLEDESFHGRFVPQEDVNHPFHEDRVCHTYRNNNVLLEGLEQAKVITKTVELHDGLPEKLNKLIGAHHLPEEEVVKRCIMMSHIFDATQKKLPHLHDAARPAVRFPRVLGITDSRINNSICFKLLNLCGSAFGNLAMTTSVTDSLIVLPIEKEGDLIQFEIFADLLLMSPHALPALVCPSELKRAQELQLPDLSPLKCTITLEKENLNTWRDIYPVDSGSSCPYVHTAIIHTNVTQLQNIFETPVTENQIIGRTLLYGFTVAAAQARKQFGANVKELPQPITIQCIQTDGRLYHFAVFQLNTLNLDGVNGMRNIFWMLPRMPLFSSCKYENGKPVLKDYNANVFKHLCAFLHFSTLTS